MMTSRKILAATSALLVFAAACSSPAQAPSDPAPTANTGAASPSAPASPGTPSSPSADSGRLPDAANQELVTATTASVDFESVEAPQDLAERLRGGGYVIVFRYTGAGGSGGEVPANLANEMVDDGQRTSSESMEKIRAYGEAYRRAGIPVNRVAGSQYFFVWQHAREAFGDPIDITRDLTGSLNFSDPAELEGSLQGLRDRTVTAPDPGQNTVLFTHQGKFDKAFGYYPDAGTTIIFEPDGSGTPRPVAVLGYEEFMSLVAE